MCFYWSTMFSLPVPGYPEGSELRIDRAICLSKIHIFQNVQSVRLYISYFLAPGNQNCSYLGKQCKNLAIPVLENCEIVCSDFLCKYVFVKAQWKCFEWLVSQMENQSKAQVDLTIQFSRVQTLVCFGQPAPLQKVAQLSHQQLHHTLI